MISLFDDHGIEPEMLGARKDKYGLCRFEDIGHYEIGNVYWATHQQNRIDGAEAKRKRGIKNSPRTPRISTKKPPFSKLRFCQICGDVVRPYPSNPKKARKWCLSCDSKQRSQWTKEYWEEQKANVNITKIG